MFVVCSSSAAFMLGKLTSSDMCQQTVPENHEDRPIQPYSIMGMIPSFPTMQLRDQGQEMWIHVPPQVACDTNGQHK